MHQQLAADVIYHPLGTSALPLINYYYYFFLHLSSLCFSFLSTFRLLHSHLPFLSSFLTSLFSASPLPPSLLFQDCLEEQGESSSPRSYSLCTSIHVRLGEGRHEEQLWAKGPREYTHQESIRREKVCRDRDMGNLKRRDAAEREEDIACFVVFLFNQIAQNLRAHVQVPECLGFNLSSPNF